MHGATTGLLAGLFALMVVVGALWWSRTSVLTRRVGSFTCLLAEQEAGPWRAGIAQYGRARMYWWRRASLAPRATARWGRQGLVLLERRALAADHPSGQRAAAVVVHCRVRMESGPADLWLQMTPEAYAGFMGWVEATPTTVVGRVI